MCNAIPVNHNNANQERIEHLVGGALPHCKRYAQRGNGVFAFMSIVR
jgi:hypothetical protein